MSMTPEYYQHDIDALREQRDALLAALKALTEALNEDVAPDACEAWDAAIAAIAKAEA